MNFDAGTIRELVIVLVPMILSLTVHEWAHAWSAFKLGDDTAMRQGRLTLSPLAHIDPIGTLLIPVVSVLFHLRGLFGWARPVPVSPYRFKRSITMRTGMMLTAVAGPASNLVIAVLMGAVITGLFGTEIAQLAERSRLGRAEVVYYLSKNGPPSIMILGTFFILNLFLAVLNMIPIPPLDGSRVLPLKWQEKLAENQMFLFLGLMIIIYYGSGVLWIPTVQIGNAVLAFFGWFV